jgi:hypothetical protein
MARDRDTGPAAAQGRILKKAAHDWLKLAKHGDTKRPQNPALVGRKKKLLAQLKIVEPYRLNF